MLAQHPEQKTVGSDPSPEPGTSMPAPYHEMLVYAHSLGYRSFTKLQENVFSQSQVYEKEQDLFICGKTSSGKTLIPILLYKRRLEQAKTNGPGTPVPKMLFVLPYRALAAQKIREFCTLFWAEGLTIVQSTGEFQQDDIAVQRGDVDIAVIIMEKVFKYSSRDETFLAKYDYLVLDEVGLVDDPSRGIRLDFILAWAKRLRKAEGRPRIIALGTPFYDWNSYVQNYQFNLYTCDDRPVELLELPVLYSKESGIRHVTQDNPSLHREHVIRKTWFDRMKKRHGTPATYCEIRQRPCAVEEPCRSDRSKACPDTKERCTDPIGFMPEGMASMRNYIVERICRYHLAQDHQILIFLNDREQVRRLCILLYSRLKDVLPPVEEPEAFRLRFLSECGLEEGDVYGILEEDGERRDMRFYCALSAGIGFHSRELPPELRTRIEVDLLESRRLKIVCSTETLAFGVNSTVDVVIIPDLQKPYKASHRSLTLNEYQNYAGRAGRLSQSSGTKTTGKGYVYTLVSDPQQLQWKRINQERQDLTPLYSKLFHGDDRLMAFALLNLLPGNGELISIQQIGGLLNNLPQPEDCTAVPLEEDIRRTLTFLLEQRLIAQSSGRSHRPKERDPQTVYGLTMYGKSLRGFLISNPDYILLRDALQICCGGIFKDIDQDRLIYRLLSAHHVESDLKNLFSRQAADPFQKTTSFFQRRLGGTAFPQWMERADKRRLFVLAAFLSWMEGDSNRQLYIHFGIHYALLDKLAGQLGYLLEIIQAMLPAILNEHWDAGAQTFQEHGIEERHFAEELEKKCLQIRQLFYCVCYGLNQKVWTKLQTFLQEQPDEGSTELLCRISADHMEPETARLLRRIAIRFRFFSMPSLDRSEDKEIRNNYRNQRRQYGKDIREMGPPVVRFFEQTLGITL